MRCFVYTIRVLYFFGLQPCFARLDSFFGFRKLYTALGTLLTDHLWKSMKIICPALSLVASNGPKHEWIWVTLTDRMVFETATDLSNLCHIDFWLSWTNMVAMSNMVSSFDPGEGAWDTATTSKEDSYVQRGWYSDLVMEKTPNSHPNSSQPNMSSTRSQFRAQEVILL